MSGEGEEAEGEEEKSPEELELEAEIRAIELDMALMDLRSQLEAQEHLVAEWQESIRKLAEEKIEAELYHIPRTDEDRREERDHKAEFKQAQESIAVLRQQVEALEALRRPEAEDA
eukprot:gb/GFBE01018614.1/.p1 GENE.gb/GFBE01018614.1/~~gb/GFBE01018614.1/.p1  ORF type:complete len:116 (+),score=43.75 gb/GFBE01018614.1/:1-348(+)